MISCFGVAAKDSCPFCVVSTLTFGIVRYNDSEFVILLTKRLYSQLVFIPHQNIFVGYAFSYAPASATSPALLFGMQQIAGRGLQG